MRVLLATDGSACAEAAVDLVAAIDWPDPTTVDVVTAVASGVAIFGGPWPPVPPIDTAEFDADLRAHASSILDATAAKLAPSKVTVTTASAAGRAADVIVNAADDNGSDLIVVGSRGHGTLETMLVGSVAAEVVDRALAPVLVVRRRSIRTVVFAWDGSVGAEHAASLLLESGIFAGSTVHVVSVADADPLRWVDASLLGGEIVATSYAEAAEPSRRQHQEMAREMVQRLAEAGFEAVPHHPDGEPATQIVRAVEAQAADLVVVGTHGRTGLTRLVMGSVARNVLLHAPCSVLVAHEKDRPRA
jgi:nucleotide-binding universal stress UspA family protein